MLAGDGRRADRRDRMIALPPTSRGSVASRSRVALRILHRVATTGALLSCLTSHAWAQVGVFGGQAGPDIVLPPVAPQRANPFDIPSREYTALSLAGWLLYPSVFVGAVFDDNVNQASANRVSGTGMRVVPSLLAQTNDGIHKTTFYGTLDGRFGLDGDSTNASTFAARAGLSHTYEAMPDLVVGLQGNYTRQRDLFAFNLDQGMPSLNSTGLGLSPVTNPVSYNQFAGSASIQKTFDRAFINVSGSVVDMIYDHASAGSPSPDGTVYTATARAGRWFMPFLYAYAEASFDERYFATGGLNSHGYRTVGGLGSDQIGLFRGEVYGGYQAEQYDFAGLGSVNSTVFGGRLYYSPTRALAFRASVDQSLGVSLLTASPTSPFGTATRVTTSLLQANYAIAPEWSVSARFGYIRTEFVGSARLDDAWTAGGAITYSLWRSFGLVLDYQFVQLASNVPLQSFTRNVITLGASYKY